MHSHASSAPIKHVCLSCLWQVDHTGREDQPAVNWRKVGQIARVHVDYASLGVDVGALVTVRRDALAVHVAKDVQPRAELANL